ncbi:MAG: RsmE family RNA methyltransferase [Candidatus Paceibacterota bacterium]
MKIHRFIDNFDLSKEELEIDGKIAHQIINVLKLKVGEKIELSDGKHISAIAHICKIDKKYVLVKIDAPLRLGFAEQDSTKKVNLFCAILKKENFELVVQKTTECGVSKIIPIISSHTIKTGLNLERIEKIAKEASEQSGRNTIPEIIEPTNFDEGLKLIKKDDLNILFNSSGEYSFQIHAYSPTGELLCSARQPAQFILKEHSLDSYKNAQINIWIGPEGGWTPKEIEKAKDLNFKIANLGTLTLRGETAAIIATYLIKNL